MLAMIKWWAWRSSYGIGPATKRSQVWAPAANNPWQVVHTPVSLFTKQYKLVPVQVASKNAKIKDTITM